MNININIDIVLVMRALAGVILAAGIGLSMLAAILGGAVGLFGLLIAVAAAVGFWAAAEALMVLMQIRDALRQKSGT